VRERRIEVVERARDQQVGVGIEVLAELVALVAQVALDLELDVLRRVAQRGGLPVAPELRLHRIVRQVGDVADHPRHPQAPFRDHAVLVEVAAVEVGVGDDRAPRDLVERDVLGRQIRRSRDRDAVAQPGRVAQRPGQRLHPAEAAAEHRGELVDAERIDQARLRVDPVLDRDDRKVRAVASPAGSRIGVRVHRPGRAEARSQVVDADHEEAPGVERLARTDQVVPPAFALRIAAIGAGRMMARVQRVADQHRIAAIGGERAVGFVDQRVVAQLAPLFSGSGSAKCIDWGWTSPSVVIDRKKTRRRQSGTPGVRPVFSRIYRAPASRNKSALPQYSQRRSPVSVRRPPSGWTGRSRSRRRSCGRG
jgi:hypothetical protein